MDRDAYLSGYKEAVAKAGAKKAGAKVGAKAGAKAGAKGVGATDLVKGTYGFTKDVGAVAGKFAMWGGDKIIKLIALMALVPPAVGAAAGLTASKLTSPSANDEKTMNAMIEEQETDRMLAETRRLTQAQQGKLKRDKETANARSLYLG